MVKNAFLLEKLKTEDLQDGSDKLIFMMESCTKDLIDLMAIVKDGEFVITIITSLKSLFGNNLIR